MVRIYTVFVLLVFSLTLRAQNLVPNPSFEDTVECPDFPGQVWRANGWYIAEETPDYFHTCCNLTHPVCGVPNNLLGSRYPTTGMAYCGFGAYASTIFSREEIGIKLLDKLTIGTRYYVTFMVSSVSNQNLGINGASNKTGILFSINKYDLLNLPPASNFCQLWTDSIITDTLGWVKVRSSFIADSNYEYITIGNFFADSTVSAIKYWGNGNFIQSYYYIDDVCVTTDSVGCDFSDYVPKIPRDAPFLVTPNPAINKFVVSFKEGSADYLQLFNVYGQSVFRKELTGSNESVEIKTFDFETGPYFLWISFGQISYTEKILITKN